MVKLMTLDQTEDISKLILKIAADAYIRKEIDEPEKDAIISFTAQCCAFIAVFKEKGFVER